MKRLLSSVEISREPDGTALLAVSRRDVPLIHAQIVCPGGESLERRTQAGASTLSAALLNEGPAGTPPLEWHRRLDRDALSLHVQARPEFWTATLGCLSEDLRPALDSWRKLLTRPGLPETEWKRLVTEHRAAAREEWNQPAYVIAWLATVQALGHGHPHARPVGERDYARLRFAEVEALARTAFRRGAGSFALIGGDVTVEEGFRALRELMGGLPSLSDSAPAEPPVRPARARTWLMDHGKTTQAFFAFSRPGMRASDPERVALRLANHALGGGGFACRLMTRIRSELGHTYGIHSSLPEERFLSAFSIQSFTQLPNFARMLALVRQVLRETAEAGFTDDEVQSAREHLYGALPLQLTSPGALLGLALDGLRAGLALSDIEQDWKALRDTPGERIHAAVRRLMGDGDFHLAVIGPAKELGAQLDGDAPRAVFPFKTPPERWPG